LTRPSHPTSLRLGDFPVAAREAFRYHAHSAGFRHVSGRRGTLRTVTALVISATDIPARVNAGRSLRPLVPDPVLESLRADRVYVSAGRDRQVEEAVELAARPRMRARGARQEGVRSRRPRDGGTDVDRGLLRDLQRPLRHAGAGHRGRGPQGPRTTRRE